MKKRSLFLAGVLAVLLVFVVGLTGCEEDVEEDTYKYLLVETSNSTIPSYTTLISNTDTNLGPYTNANGYLDFSASAYSSYTGKKTDFTKDEAWKAVEDLYEIFDEAGFDDYTFAKSGNTLEVNKTGWGNFRVRFSLVE